jgi:TonB family protein
MVDRMQPDRRRLEANLFGAKPVFQVLTASGPQASPGIQRLVLSIGVHVGLIGGAVALTSHPFGPIRNPPSELTILDLAAPPVPPSAPSVARKAPHSGEPPAPVWEPSIGLPDLNPQLPSITVPNVADLLHSATQRPEAGWGANNTTLARPVPFTAAGVDDPVEILTQPAPRYPAALAQARVTGRVELAYVVDTLGRAEPGSLRTLMSAHPALDSAARASVLASRYRPARLRGSAVRQLVRQMFGFRLRE